MRWYASLVVTSALVIERELMTKLLTSNDGIRYNSLLMYLIDQSKANVSRVPCFESNHVFS